MAPADDGGSPITKYIVQWNEGGSSTDFVQLVEVDDSTLTYTKDALTKGEIYEWRIVAVNAIESGPESASL